MVKITLRAGVAGALTGDPPATRLSGPPLGLAKVASSDVAASAAGQGNDQPGEWAGKVIPLEELAELLARFGMIVGVDPSREANNELQAVQLAHALVGAAEAHATRAEQAYRDAGAGPADLTKPP